MDNLPKKYVPISLEVGDIVKTKNNAFYLVLEVLTDSYLVKLTNPSPNFKPI